jgi:nitrogen fixation/metabolism regulation signal transduction histidine kinase
VRVIHDSPALRQLLFMTPVVLNVALIMASGQLDAMGIGWYQAGVVVALLATVAAFAAGRGRWPRSVVWLIPVADLVAVALMRLLPESGGIGVVAVVPAMWLGVDYLMRGVVATALITVSTLSLPTLAYFGTGAEPWSRALVLPLVATNVALGGAVLARLWSQKSRELAIKHEQLERTFEHEQQVAAQQELIAQTIDVGLVMIDRYGTYTSLNSKQRELLEVCYPDGHQGRAGQLGLVYHEDRVTPLTRDEMPTMRALRGRRFTDYLVWVGEPSAHQLAISVSATPKFDATGEFDGAVLVYKDVTDLVSALRVKDDFVATVSHELRTPLTSIMGFLDLVTETDETLTPTTRTQLEIVRRNSERLLRLVSDLLLAAQTDEGRMVLSLRQVDLSRLVEQSVAEVAPQAAAGKVSLTRDIERGVVAEVDEMRVRQMADNLVSNAVKYTPPGGLVDVSLAVSRGGEVVLRVVDTGIGITAEDQQQLFTRFFRASEAENLAIQGAGLGLAITKAIIEAHGGTITVASEERRGTAFEVRLPRTSTRTASIPRPQRPVPDRAEPAS